MMDVASFPKTSPTFKTTPLSIPEDFQTYVFTSEIFLAIEMGK
jgi:hypothetical protein